MFIAHFALKNEWEKESLSNSYSYSLIKEKGYIPCYKIADIKEANINLPTLKDYIILYIILTVMSYLISTKFAKKLFKKSAITTLGEAV